MLLLLLLLLLLEVSCSSIFRDQEQLAADGIDEASIAEYGQGPSYTSDVMPRLDVCVCACVMRFVSYVIEDEKNQQKSRNLMVGTIVLEHCWGDSQIPLFH